MTSPSPEPAMHTSVPRALAAPVLAAEQERRLCPSRAELRAKEGVPTVSHSRPYCESRHRDTHRVFGESRGQHWVEFLEEINAGLGPCEVSPSERETGEEEVFQAEGTPCIISQKGETLLWEF